MHTWSTAPSYKNTLKWWSRHMILFAYYYVFIHDVYCIFFHLGANLRMAHSTISHLHKCFLFAVHWSPGAKSTFWSHLQAFSAWTHFKFTWPLRHSTKDHLAPVVLAQFLQHFNNSFFVSASSYCHSTKLLRSPGYK